MLHNSTRTPQVHPTTVIHDGKARAQHHMPHGARPTHRFTNYKRTFSSLVFTHACPTSCRHVGLCNMTIRDMITQTIDTIRAGRHEVQYRGTGGLRGGWQAAYSRHCAGSSRCAECLAWAVMDLVSPTVTPPSSTNACSGCSALVEMHCVQQDTVLRGFCARRGRTVCGACR